MCWLDKIFTALALVPQQQQQPPSSARMEMMSVVEQFRTERYNSIDQEVAERRARNLICEHLREQVDRLKAYKAEADRRMMAAGLDLPPEP